MFFLLGGLILAFYWGTLQRPATRHGRLEKKRLDDSELKSAWIERLKQGDPASAEEIWKRYYERLVRLARRTVAGERRVADEEDIVLSAFNSFFRGAKQERFPRLEDQHDLWQLLLMLTVRKIADQVRREGRQKRGSGLVRGESAFCGRRGEPAGDNRLVLGKEPSPELSVEVADQLEYLLGRLEETARGPSPCENWKDNRINRSRTNYTVHCGR